ncbi:MAG: cation diffusion facilitator family transporter [Lachnospiraceae bacterium]|nr:cation diffusion facilitator family transporter [Lachnospiraceae bacterium]
MGNKKDKNTTDNNNITDNNKTGNIGNNNETNKEIINSKIENRQNSIIKVSVVGILANILLAGFKAVVGLLSHSIAIVLDAVNNLSDALSSIITIIGTVLAGKAPDKKHPLGHGRIEYLSAMVVSAIVLYAGLTSLIESIKKIIHPVKADYSTPTLIIVGAAIFVKIILGLYVKKQGQKLNSNSLIASGQDALFDAIISTSVLASAIIFIMFDLSLEAYVGAIISVIIIKSGIEMLSETISEIVGRRIDPEITRGIRETIVEEPEVYGAFDLLLHNYGPETLVGSVHIEVADYMTANKIDELTRRIQQKVFEKHGIIMEGIGIYSYNTTDSNVNEITHKLLEI